MIKPYYLLKSFQRLSWNDNSIENNVFSPIMSGNFCCIDKVGADYNYLNYFSEDSSIEKLLEQSNSLYSSLYDITNTQISPIIMFMKIWKFQKASLPDEEDVTQEDILLYETFVYTIGVNTLGRNMFMKWGLFIWWEKEWYYTEGIWYLITELKQL